jgi:putative ABC transport system permease protein
MALVPFSYNLRSLFVRKATTFLTVLGIAATVTVVSGVLALQQGFVSLADVGGRDDVVVFLRPGANNESDSFFDRDRANALVKSRREIAVDENQQPLAAIECFLAVRRFRVAGGETNVPIRGVQPMSFKINEQNLRIVEGRNLTFGSDEVIVGKRLVGKFRDCSLGDVIEFNTTPFRVVGVFEDDGFFGSEIWGDMERISVALQRPAFNRVIARLAPGVDLATFRESIRTDPQYPATLETERFLLNEQTTVLSGILIGLGTFLGVVMGIAAIFTATNTMLAALASRMHEIGVLLAIGFRPGAIFVSFLLESVLLALIGGAIGCVLVQPINGIETSTSNFATFSDVSFAFRVTPTVLVTAVGFSLVLGVIGGAWPALRAARMRPTDALRRR